jgi:iron complex transport system substrate-binding protein
LQSVPESNKVRVFIEHFPGLYTAGTGTFMHEIITLAGGKNIAAPIREWGRMTEEEVVGQAPDVILYTEGHTRQGNGTGLRKLILSRAAWKSIPAVKNRRVVGIDKDLISRPCPRLTRGLLAVSKVLYPERFRDIEVEGILK